MHKISTYHLLYELMQNGKGGVWPSDKAFDAPAVLYELSKELKCQAKITVVVESFLQADDFSETEKNTIKAVWRIYDVERNALDKLRGQKM